MATQKSAAEIAQIREDFIEKIGVLSQADGIPRIAGRLLALLIYDGERVSFGELAKMLNVSRGSVSSSVRLLEDREIIKRVAKPGDRQDYFQIADDAYITLLENSANSSRRAHKEITATLAELPESEVGPRARLSDYADFYEAINEAVNAISAKLRAKL